MAMNAGQDFSIVAVDKFIQATRDSGYKGTSSAVAELVDNSLQAGATEIAISITVNECGDACPVVLSVIDNGRVKRILASSTEIPVPTFPAIVPERLSEKYGRRPVRAACTWSPGGIGTA